MTPRDYLKRFHHDARLVTGLYFPTNPLAVRRGERIGVVLLSPGGPSQEQEITPFLYRLLMDPALVGRPLGRRTGWAWHRVARQIARYRTEKLIPHYRAIGGGSPINRLTREQTHTLEVRLNAALGGLTGVTYHTYLASRYAHPSSEEAIAQMRRDGIDRVVLLPLYPQYAKTTTGSSLHYWWQLGEAGERPDWPTTQVLAYADHPKYIQAMSERIDEALQRFPRETRAEVAILFRAHGMPLFAHNRRNNSYHRQIYRTVASVMAHRGHDHPFAVCFRNKFGLGERLFSGSTEQLEILADEGKKAVLMVPVTFVSDHLETAYRLDVRLREEASTLGIERFEVAAGLNCHPLFIEALTEMVRAQIVLPAPVARPATEELRPPAQSRIADDEPARPADHPRRSTS